MRTRWKDMWNARDDEIIRGAIAAGRKPKQFIDELTTPRTIGALYTRINALGLYVTKPRPSRRRPVEKREAVPLKEVVARRSQPVAPSDFIPPPSLARLMAGR